MAVTAIPLDTIPSINPATGKVLEQFAKTPSGSLPELLGRARDAQRAWAGGSMRQRCDLLRPLRGKLLASRDKLAEAVVLESGKPKVEALFADVFVALDSAEYLSRHATSLLWPEKVPHHSTAAKAKSGQLFY